MTQERQTDRLREKVAALRQAAINAGRSLVSEFVKALPDYYLKVARDAATGDSAVAANINRAGVGQFKNKVMAAARVAQQKVETESAGEDMWLSRGWRGPGSDGTSSRRQGRESSNN